MKYMPYKLSVIFLLCVSHMYAVDTAPYKITNGEIHQVKARSGDGISVLLNRYELGGDKALREAFLTLNQLSTNAPLYRHKKYKLPVYLYNYNGKSIRSTIGITDWDQAVRIKEYNEALLHKGIRSTHFKSSKILWVPFNEYNQPSDGKTDTHSATPMVEAPTANNTSNAPVALQPKKLKVKSVKDKLYGSKYATVDIIDQRLKGHVFYVVTGHGGPDPGTVCTDCSHKLCEDEYAYDVSLRLARNLRQHGATVELVIQDKNDGIRDKTILRCDKDERLADGKKIPIDHLERLVQRTKYINKKYKTYKAKGYHDQSVISLHIDSNSKSHKQDVFFCYYKGSADSKKLATDLRDKFREKYNEHQKNRGYKGYLHQRNIYVLRKTAPPAVLIELANINNKHDHKRILQKENRQALANWIYEGLEERSLGSAKLLATN